MKQTVPTSQREKIHGSNTAGIMKLGVLVGTLDILAALVDYYVATHKNPIVIFKFIASGLLGQVAFAGGTGIILLGILLHYCIAIFFTGLFFILYSKLPIMAANRLVSGLLYGIIIGLVMNFIVVPLSFTPKMPYTVFKVLKAILILVGMIGLPLSFLIKRFMNEEQINRT